MSYYTWVCVLLVVTMAFNALTLWHLTVTNPHCVNGASSAIFESPHEMSRPLTTSQQHISTDWKDDWIRKWIKKNEDPNFNLQCERDSCKIPKYLPERVKNSTYQKIPRVMWFTWYKANTSREHWSAVRSWIDKNPEYEFIYFNDDDQAKFICELTSPMIHKTFASIFSGAGKADIWRLTLMERYGGVYLDFDTSCLAPLNQFIQADNDLVSGLDENGFHQWAMIYTPHHPFFPRCLELVIATVTKDFVERKHSTIISILGQDPYMEGIRQILKANGCFHGEDNYHLDTVQNNTQCSRNFPYKIGNFQVYKNRLGAVNFKHHAAVAEFNVYNRVPIYNTEEKIQEILNKCQ